MTIRKAERTKGFHFNYVIQAWVQDGVTQQCHHPKNMRITRPCCNSWLFTGVLEEETEYFHIGPLGTCNARTRDSHIPIT